jgi:predicted HTH domain antitoxin
MTTYHTTLPDDLAAALATETDHAALQAIAQEAFVVRLFALGKISSGKVAQLLTISRREALDLISSYNVSIFDETMDLEAELRILQDVSCI